MTKHIFLTTFIVLFFQLSHAQSVIGLNFGPGAFSGNSDAYFYSYDLYMKGEINRGIDASKQSGLAKTLQYRWYKTDRGFRTIRLTQVTNTTNLDIERYDFFNDEIIGSKAEMKFKATYFHYDAGFALANTEIDDKFMPYWGGGYLLGIQKVTLASETDKEVNAEKYSQSTFIVGADIKIGMDYNFNRKLAVNAEYRYMFLTNGLGSNFSVGLLYKFY